MISIGGLGASLLCTAVPAWYCSFSFFGLLLGFPEAGNLPGAVKSNAEWFPVKERATARRHLHLGASIGSVIAPAPDRYASYLGFGWRITFLIALLASIVWVILVIINKTTPGQAPLAGRK